MEIVKNFIAIDGPNGVGKSTIIELLKQRLNKYGLDCVFTKEPTNSPLGNFIRSNQNSYRGQTLAALVAANRYEHIESLIQPSLNNGKSVFTDRYFASSLVYQVQDGLTYNFIQNLNSGILLPSLYFILTASHETIEKRLASRSQLTRFETITSSRQEAELFSVAGDILREKGVNVCFLENEYSSSEETANQMVAHLMNHLYK